MPVAWPDRRSDVIDALDCLSQPPPELSPGGLDRRWPDLTNAVHWVVDDTGWDERDPNESIGLILADEDEAAAVRHVVSLVVVVSNRQGAAATDAAWFADEAWPDVRTAASRALAVMASRP